jgi:hypothetical protein
MTPHAGADNGTTFRLVTRVFVRRLLDNDLLSPHADRHESLAVLYGLVVSLAVFATFLLSTNYLAAFIQLPGPAALSALSDRFLFIAASITISALGALMVWEALALEARDAAILGPLPIAARTITRAKITAATAFGAVLTVALNAVPSVLYPTFLTLNIRGTRGATILRLMAAHATAVTTAGLFGFFGILAIRGSLRLLMGEQAFRRASSSVQSALVVSMVTALLLAPTVRARDVRSWVSHAAAPRWPARPVLWYLGVNETQAGHLVAETPVVLPPRFSFLAFPRQENEDARATYRGLLPEFAGLARWAWLSLPLIAALALATFLWTNRRLPERSAAVPAPSRIRTIARRMGERYTRDDPETQAGFFFALQTFTRSAPHRTIIAIALAVGLTHTLAVLAQNGRHAFEIRSVPYGVLGVSTMLLLSLLAGVSYGATVPAEPAANWTIRMAWLGDERGYLAGVKRAAGVLVAVLLVVLLPLHVALLGSANATVHSLLGLLFAMPALDALFLFYRKLPFACSYVPFENPKIAWPAGFAGLLLVTYAFARAERWALQTNTRTMALAVILGAFALLVRAIDREWRRGRRPVNFDDRPAFATQRLGLLEHIVVHD